MKAFLLIVCMGWLLQGYAQQDYFVLIQGEKGRPFYVRMGEKNYSSSAIGHLILSNLKDSAYSITIGFPQNQFPEQEFIIRISRKDRGYELKNLGDKGWNLFDIATMELIPPVKAATNQVGGGTSYIKKDDNFSRLMAGVVNDTAVLYTVVMQKPVPVIAASETQKTETDSGNITKNDPPITKNDPPVTKAVPPITKKEPPVTKNEPIVTKNDPPKTVTEKPKVDSVSEKATEVVNKPAQEIKEPQKPAAPVISVIRTSNTDSGYHMLIADGAKDSIDIFIPSEKEKTEAGKTAIEKKEVTDTKTETPKEEPVKNVLNEKPADNNASKTNPVTEPANNNTAKKNQDANVPADTLKVKKVDSDASKNEAKLADTTAKAKKLVMINSDCRDFAGAMDVDKLRVKMLREKDAESRIAAAKKIFKTKCFNASQVKALSELFPYDEQKYHFFEAAYPFVSDTNNFKELVSLFQDPVYAQRFRKLVRLD